LDEKDLEALLERVKAAVDTKDYELLEKLVESFVYLSQLIEDKETTIGRLRKILFGPQSEKTEGVLKGQDAEEKNAEKASVPESAGGGGGVPEKEAEGKSPEEGKKEKPPGHGRNGAKKYKGAEKVSVRHEKLKPGDACPGARCDGRVYRQGEPGVLVRLVGQAPVAAKIWELEKLRCSLCGEVYTAKAPEGVGEEKYDASSASMIGLLKYGSGLPFNRLEKLEGSLGIPLPAGDPVGDREGVLGGAGACLRGAAARSGAGGGGVQRRHADEDPRAHGKAPGEARGAGRGKAQPPLGVHHGNRLDA